MRQLLFMACASALLCPLSARAEPEPAGPFEPQLHDGRAPVDQGVGDLDPHGASLRRVEPGNALFSHRVRLYELPGARHNAGQPQIDPATGQALPRTYRYNAPGVQALFDRPDYLMQRGAGTGATAGDLAADREDGLLEVMPPGGVYDLRPETALEHLMSPFRPDAADEPGHASGWEDRRIDQHYRLDGRVDSSAPSDGVDRRRHPHIPPDTPIPSRLPRRFEPGSGDEDEPTPSASPADSSAGRGVESVRDSAPEARD